MTFQKWLTAKLDEIIKGYTIEEKLEEAMQRKNLKIETIVDGQWVEILD